MSHKYFHKKLLMKISQLFLILIQQQKKTLPLIHALETGSTAVKREITGIYMKRVLEPSDISRVLELLDEVDAKNYALHVIEDILVKARDNMLSCGIDRSKTDELIDWVIGQK